MTMDGKPATWILVILCFGHVLCDVQKPRPTDSTVDHLDVVLNSTDRQANRRPPVESRLDLPHTAGQLQAVLHRINDRLTMSEALATQQLRKLDSIDYRITRLEVLGHGHGKSTGDKSDEKLGRKLDNLEYEINKYGTILDVIREDMDRIQQRQTEIKVALTSITAASGTGNPAFGGRETYDAGSKTTADVLPTKLANLAGQIRNLTFDIGRNLSEIDNVTRTLTSAANQMLTKQYFNVAIREILHPRHDVLTPFRGSIAGPTCRDDDREQSLPRDCAELQEIHGHNRSGVYRIRPHDTSESFFVNCDLESDGGGWTVMQNRQDGSIDFYRDWMDYKYGFGNVAGEYWLGNEKIHLMTKQDVYELHIRLEDFEAVKVAATYSSFALGSENDGYMIKLLGSYAGDAGDSFTYHAGVKFSTRDMDQDGWEGGHCAEAHAGGWWYKGCEMANLNGRYLAGDVPEDLLYQGVYWYEWHGPDYSLQKSVMKIRPTTFRRAAGTRDQ